MPHHFVSGAPRDADGEHGGGGFPAAHPATQTQFIH